jgi:hypothetical protein
MKLANEIQQLKDYLSRVHQYHLGAKPSFMQRNHWNEINDALHTATIKADTCSAIANQLIAERADILGRATDVREVQGQGPELGSPE